MNDEFLIVDYFLLFLFFFLASEDVNAQSTEVDADSIESQ